MSKHCSVGTNHIALKIILFLQLESFKILQNSCACVSDILLGDAESLFKLGTR